MSRNRRRKSPKDRLHQTDGGRVEKASSKVEKAYSEVDLISGVTVSLISFVDRSVNAPSVTGLKEAVEVSRLFLMSKLSR